MAQSRGYSEMRLDTLPSMTEAVALYRKAGFVPIDPHYETPVAGTLFLGRRLRPADNAAEAASMAGATASTSDRL